MTGSRFTILLSGMIAAVPRHGGASWAVLQYMLGLRRLGHTVYFVEPVEANALWPPGVSLRSSANASYFRQTIDQFGLGGCCALQLQDSQQTVGLPYEDLQKIARQSDLLINISGKLRDAALTEPIGIRVYVDLDPGFTQLWHSVQGLDMHFAGHTHFVTVGQAIGLPGCAVPPCGRAWIPTLPPVVLEYWPPRENEESGCDGLTTVANWRGYGSIEHQGIFYGQKAHSLRPLIRLPTLSTEKYTLALAIHPAEEQDLTALHTNGWHLLDPSQVAGTPASYRRFIQGSKAEIGIAKSGYVAANCGWFSDRSVCYLASGRPVLAQETGFSQFLPVGQGLFAFKTMDDVLVSLETLRQDYQRHRRAARALAEEYFDSDKVLNRLLACIGVAQ